MSSKRAQEEKQLYDTVKSAFEAILAPANLTAEMLGDLAKEAFIKGFRFTNKEIKARTPAIVQLCKLVKSKFANLSTDNMDLSIPTTFFCSGVQLAGEHISRVSCTGIAFAIWVLDILSELNKVEELDYILPEELNYTGSIVFDINHSNELLERIAYVCDSSEIDDDAAETLKQIVALIPKEYIDKGVENYDKLAWQFLEISLGEYSSLIKQKEALLHRIGNPLDFVKLNNMSPSLVEDDIKEKMAMSAKVDNIDFEIAAVFNVFQHYYDFDIKNGGSLKIFNKINEIPIDNPYELCGIYYVLKLRADFRYWAMGPFATVVSFAAKRLPWVCDLEYEEPHCNNDLITSDIYTLKFNSSMFGNTRNICGLLNTSQIIYHLSGGGILPRQLNGYKSERMILEKNGVASNTIDFITIASSVLAQLYKRNEYYGCAPMDEDETELGQEQQLDVSNMEFSKIYEILESAKSTIKKVRSENHTIEEQRRKLQKEYEELNQVYQQEHRELVDLRNYIYNQDDERQEDTQSVDLDIKYPYKVKRNVIVFGGHETWSKAIKLLFENVKFVNKDTLPNSDMIKNADIVWVQPNSIGHSKYYKILDVVRTYRIPLRYFTFASANKCAEQIVIEDMK